MELLVLWLLCGIITGVVGSNKGRDGCSWFALGVLLGPFGIILALVVSPNRKQLDEQAVAFGDMKKCPYCAELVRKEAVKCRYCGESLAVGASAPVTPESRHFTGNINCPGCNRGRPYEGSVVIAGRRYCSDCAARIA
jgi:hypothetical protein